MDQFTFQTSSTVMLPKHLIEPRMVQNLLCISENVSPKVIHCNVHEIAEMKKIYPAVGQYSLKRIDRKIGIQIKEKYSPKLPKQIIYAKEIQDAEPPKQPKGIRINGVDRLGFAYVHRELKARSPNRSKFTDLVW
ncbi:hypothetical protein SS50377_20731 [Spironucleus salmonicida]|uniref:Uncharacterized protein n=1 Tax=Spironucleus salmonicida TaxID=348837 RepID=V6M691_9EUKA|nr:hypothetical protein SS50377_20731 [Spironucleus salmonicida]|eukprot:EST48914.1 Hypothetical protein SS50377_10839 [Spironucleus salmonicida]